MLSAFLISYSLNRSEEKRLLQLQSLISLIRFFKLRIDCYCSPVDEILSRADRDLLTQCGFRDPPVSPKDLLTSLSPEPDGKVYEILSSFVSELGGVYREEQLKSCDYHINLLCELEKGRASALPSSKKLRSTLILSAAAGIVILLI